MLDGDEDLRTRLNAETARIGWKELEKHFARGVLVVIAPSLDLVEVAVQFARDERAAVEAWVKEGKIHRASVEDAEDWNRGHPEFWAVVTAPWVLVQESRAAEPDSRAEEPTRH